MINIQQKWPRLTRKTKIKAPKMKSGAHIVGYVALCPLVIKFALANVEISQPVFNYERLELYLCCV